MALRVQAPPSIAISPHLHTSNPSHHGVAAEEEEEEEDVCRICRTPGDADSPLYHPCACSGSIKFVHQSCLLQWLTHSNARQCEVCKHPFSFSSVYAENAPSRLPFHELLLGMAVKASQGMHFFVRLAFVLLVWIIFIPFTTFWIWRLTFVRSISEAQKLFLGRLSPTLLLTDCVHGFLLSAGIVLIFLGATSLREYFRHFRDLGHNIGREDDGIDRQFGVRIGRRQGQGALIPVDRPGQDGGVGVQVQPAGGHGEGGGAGQGLAAGVGQFMRRNAENVAAARLEQPGEQLFDGADDVDGAEDVPFDELVGMQGPVFHLVENAFTVLASNAIFLGLIAFLPFTLGRIVLFLVSQLVVASTSSFKLASDLSNATTGTIYNLNTTIPLANFSTSMMTKSAFYAEDAFAGNSSLEESLVSNFEGLTSFAGLNGADNSIHALSEAMVTSLQLSDATTVAIGYTVILISVCFYWGLVALSKHSRGEPLVVGRIRGVASIAEAVRSVARQVIAGLNYILTMAKVTFLLLVELGVFPFVCGWWLDICTLRMLGATVANRVGFFWASPLTSSLLHWLVGIVCMLQISIFVSLLREVLRPGVLYFLRDPADPNYNPFRDMIDDPIHKHARRVLLSLVVYGSLIVMLVFVPVRLAMSLAPSAFPIDIRVSDPFTEIPADMLLFHICIPFTIEHFRPRATIKTVLFHWLSVVGWFLGLSEFLLPGPEDINVQARGARAVEIQQEGVRNQNQARLLGAPDDNGELHDGAATGDDALEDLDADDSTDSEEYKFALRIFLLLFGAWLTLLSFNSAMVLVPVSLGRAIFSSFLHLPITLGVKCNDFYAFNIGCYVVWAIVAAIGYAMDYLNKHKFKVLLMQTLKWSGIVAKSSVLLSLWIVVIPVLVGLLFELLVVVPLRVPIDESPIFLLYQDWALGLVFLKIWTRLVMLGQMIPLADESWRMKFEQVRMDGFSRLRGFWVLREIVAPILVKLLTALCVPYVFARGLFPVLGYPLIVNSAVYRFAWSGCLMLGLIWYGMKRVYHWCLDLHNTIRDDRYLIGKRLHNFGERITSTSSSLASIQRVPERTERTEAMVPSLVLEHSESSFPINDRLTAEENNLSTVDGNLVTGESSSRHEDGVEGLSSIRRIEERGKENSWALQRHSGDADICKING